MGESVDFHNAVIRSAKVEQIPPATNKEIELFDFNHNGKIDDNIEKDVLKEHRNYKKEAEFSKEFDFDKSGFLDNDLEKMAYKNYKLGIIAHFFSKTQVKKFNSLENIKNNIADELTTSDMLKKEVTNDKFIDDLYFDIKYNSCQTYIKILPN